MVRKACNNNNRGNQCNSNNQRNNQTIRTDSIAGSSRIACVNLPALPLQLLLRRQPDWRNYPVAVVAEDNPQAPLLWANEAARTGGVLPGMSYASALSLVHELRAATIEQQEIDDAIDRLHKHLLRYSPRVEPAGHGAELDTGVFWLDAGGLDRLWGGSLNWARRLHLSLQRGGFFVSVVVGFSRFGSFCLARVQRGVTILPSAQDEATACKQVQLSRLELSPKTRDNLNRLGLHTVGNLLDKTPSSLAARFGPELAKLVQLAHGQRFDPLQPTLPPQPVRCEKYLDEPETNSWRLLFLIKSMLHPLLNHLADRCQAVAQLHLDLKMSDRTGTTRRESLRPAAPTLDVVLLMELIKLRLENIELTGGAELVTLETIPTEAPAKALELFHTKPTRNLEAAMRAIARVRAELGDNAVVQAELQPGHLPETTYRWTRIQKLEVTTPTKPPRSANRPLIRRLLPRPRPLLSGPPNMATTQGKKLLHAACPITPADDHTRTHGPNMVSTSWWTTEIRRVYHFLEVPTGEILWIYYDELKKSWYLQGRVE